MCKRSYNSKYLKKEIKSVQSMCKPITKEGDCVDRFVKVLITVNPERD